MGTRYFSGGRSDNKRSAASELLRFEMQKKGKLQPGERYKRILKKKLDDSRAEAMGGRVKTFQLPGSIKEARKMSARAEQAIKEIAMKKAAKQAKIDRKMVIIQPRNYHNGSLDRKGKITDIAGNVIGQVQRKDGKITTTSGWGLGKYKPGSHMTNITIQEGINKYSPYFINLRKMQAMQAGGGDGEMVTSHGPRSAAHAINLYGHAQHNHASDYSSNADPDMARSNISGGATSWGFMSDNPWGVNTDNVWGTMVDNVWGGTENNVWGGIGDSSWWGYKGPRIWGTGNGKNYIKGITNAISALFGIGSKGKLRGLSALRGGSDHAVRGRSGSDHAVRGRSGGSDHTTRSSGSSGSRSGGSAPPSRAPSRSK